MKTWYIIGAIVAYYYFTKSPAQQLAAVQAQAQKDATSGVVPINIADTLTSSISSVDNPIYQIPTVSFSDATGVNN